VGWRSTIRRATWPTSTARWASVRRGLRPHNRWGGFKSLRERWLAHLESTACAPVLLIDEAQEMSPATLSELRLLSSARFDSQPLLSVVLAGDAA
jgi:general secretion pathway protein A